MTSVILACWVEEFILVLQNYRYFKQKFSVNCVYKTTPACFHAIKKAFLLACQALLKDSFPLVPKPPLSQIGTFNPFRVHVIFLEKQISGYDVTGKFLISSAPALSRSGVWAASQTTLQHRLHPTISGAAAHAAVSVIKLDAYV